MTLSEATKFAEHFSVFQDAVKRAGTKSHAAATVSGPGPMTWRTGDTDTQEFRVAGELVMTASVSISPGPGFVALVGESHFQDALQRAKRSRQGDDEPVYVATSR